MSALSGIAAENYRKNKAESERIQQRERDKDESIKRRFLYEQLVGLPFGIAEHLTREWSQRVRASGQVELANEWVRSRSIELKKSHIHEAFDNQAIVGAASRLSKRTSRCTTFRAAVRCVEGYGLHQPKGREITEKSAINRMRDPRWIRRQMRRQWTRQSESIHRDVGLIRHGRSPYATPAAIRYRRRQKQIQLEWMSKVTAINEIGEKLSLLAIRNRSNANAVIRRGEFMVHVRGFEEIAREHEHGADFYTLTTPSAYHAQEKDGAANPRYKGFSVVDGQKWLRKMWARARAEFKRQFILVYGVRIAEPHHDATPHWHILLFVPDYQREAVRRIMHKIWLSEYADEPGAVVVRCQVTAIDSARGSAVGYVAKYVSKNIDGHGSIGGQKSDETGEPITSTTDAVETWASINGARQFQFFGGPTIGLWRELWRLREVVYDPEIERARMAASEQKSWSSLVREVGGIWAGRKTTVRMWSERLGTLSSYGDVQGAVPAGVMRGSVYVRSRYHVWRLVWGEASSAGNGGAGEEVGAGETVSAESGSESGSDLNPPWTRVNNCTGDGPGSNEPSGWTNPNETSTYGPH